MSGSDTNSSNPLGGANPTGSTGGATRKCTKCTITSMTTASVPADKARTKIGIGEEVILTVDNGPATWSILSGGGKLDPAAGTMVIYKAGDKAGSAIIKADGPGCSCTIEFTVVAPASLTIEQKDGTGIHHTPNQPDCGFLGQPYVQPDDVSFINIDVREMNSACSAEGYFKPFNGQNHMPGDVAASEWCPVGECVAGKGSPVNADDHVYARYTGGPVVFGSLVCHIVWQYKVGGGAAHKFPKPVVQRSVVYANGMSVTSKGDTTKTTNLADPGSLADPSQGW
jgi:hypothetical protein